MKLLFVKLFLIVIFIFSASCNHRNEKTNRSNFDQTTNTISEIDSSKLLTRLDTNQFFQEQNLQKEKKADSCFFQIKNGCSALIT